MRADRPSLTASLVAAVRALYAELPAPYTLDDPTAADLLPLPLALTARAGRLGPLVHRGLGGALFGITWHVALRTLAIDQALRDGLGAGATAVVLLGAGLDNRPRRLPELAGTRVFEVDHPGLQRYREEKIRRAGANVTPVPVDFERDRLDASLLAAGLSPGEKSFWIWEGVTVYLTPDAIDATLAAAARCSAPGSRLALTYTRPGAIGGLALTAATRALGRLVGEPVRGMMRAEEAAERLGRAGFAVRSDESALDWAPRFWPEAPSGLREWERLAVAERI